MFKEDYRKAMSFSVDRELIEKTARKMEQVAEKASAGEKRERIHFAFSGRVTAVLASVCLVAAVFAGYYFTDRGVFSKHSNEMFSMTAGDACPEPESGGAADDQELSNAPGLLGNSAQSDAAMDKSAGTSPVLPKIDCVMSSSGGMGFEGLMAYNVNEVIPTANPGTDAEPDLLPVYLYPASAVPSGIIQADEALTEADVTNAAKSIYAALGGDAQTTGEVTTDRIDEKETAVTGYSVGGVLVRTNGSVTVLFGGEKGLAEPAVTPSGSSPAEKLQNAAEYFYGEYQELFGYESPKFSLQSDYSFAGELNTRVMAYDAAGIQTEQIISYQFHNISFGIVPDEANPKKYRLTSLHYEIAYLGKELGEYPIITREEAEAELLKGNYLTTVPEDSAGKLTADSIKYQEIVYWNSPYLKYHQPMYRFLVELNPLDTVSMAAGLKTYGAYYVPAVSPEYLNEVPASQPFN